jgi:hypothetical protein
MPERREEEEPRLHFRARPADMPDLTESYKVAFETIKQLTTLCAGSIVVIGTFLKDIFPSKNGTLDVGAGIKLLITLAFISFGLSLIVSSYAMLDYSRSLRFLELSRTPEGREELQQRYRRPRLLVPVPFTRGYTTLPQLLLRYLPLPFFTAGLLFFGVAVVLNLYR